MQNVVKVRVPGTTANCGPGFDTIGIACGIYNELELTILEDDRLIIEVFGEGSDHIPVDGKNVVWQAVSYLFQQAGVKIAGAKLRMVNNIPLSRGLGSSAAAIVAGLTAANAASGYHFSKRDIFQMAARLEGHPDNVAPAVFGGVTVSVVTDGGVVETLPFIPVKPFKMVVAVPDFYLATKVARTALPDTVPLTDAVFNVGRSALLVGALCQGRLDLLQVALGDKLHQPYRSKLVPGMEDVFAAAGAAGALGTALSGAGPCLIAFAEDNCEQIGGAMVAAFAKQAIDARYLILDIDVKGVQVV